MTCRIVCLLVVAFASPAFAEQPWKVGVTDAQQDRAKVLLDEGNVLFTENKFVEALAKYHAAIKEWNHPAIHFNAVRCLIQLDRILEAAESLEQALKYGADPLNKDVYREALSYKKLLAGRIGDLDIACTQAGVVMSLDGKPLPACPTQVAQRVLPGRHEVVAKKPGMVTQTLEIIVAGGDRQTVAVKLSAIARTGRVVHRWSIWLPWTVFSGGVALAGAGTLIQLNAISRMSSYDDIIKRDCALGCPADYKIRRKQLAERHSAIGITMISVGAAAAIAGGVMLVLNRGTTVYEQPTKRVDVTPLDGGGLVTLSGRF